MRLFKSIYGHDEDIALNYIEMKLRKRFGDVAEVSKTLRGKLASFPRIQDHDSLQSTAYKLRELSDLCMLVEAHQSEVSDLNCLNYQTGLEAIRQKIPDFLNRKWRSIKKGHTDFYGSHPTFRVFCEFLESEAELLCSDVPFQLQDSIKKIKNIRTVSTNLQTKVDSKDEEARKNADVTPTCPIHRSQTHSLNNCFSFRKFDVQTKRLFLISHKLCFKCYKLHLAKNCKVNVQCDKCKSTFHNTDMHVDKSSLKFKNQSNKHNFEIKQEFKPIENESPVQEDSKSFKSISNFGRSCGKTLLVDVYDPKNVNNVARVYCIIDEQSNQSFISPNLLNHFHVTGPIHNYKLSTLSSCKSNVVGRIASNFLVKGVSEETTFNLPNLFENDCIPDTKDEVATPKEVANIPHLKHLSQNFLKLDGKAEVALLLGRDAGNIMATYMEDTVAPFAHHTPLGWAVVGSLCPSKNSNSFHSKTFRTKLDHEHFKAKLIFPDIRTHVFAKYSDDEETSASIEDKKFANLIENNVTVSPEGNLQMPLPLKDFNKVMPDNSEAVYRRQVNTLKRLSNNPNKLSESLKFMDNLIQCKHVEQVPQSEAVKSVGQTWYLPIFPVEHPKKHKIRLVYDSAAIFHGACLNENLMQGPDHNNLLFGVLQRFREHRVAVVSDIQSMYHCFLVNPEHRDYLRFYWYEGNDANKAVVSYRARVHIFGNKSSPSVAIYGLRRAVDEFKDSQEPIEQAAYNFVSRSFYVDDGLYSADTPEDALKVLSAAKTVLSKFNIKLHKILSNSKEVVNSFPNSDRADEMKGDEFDFLSASLNKTLGVAWNYVTDQFSIKVEIPDRPFTKRGVVSVLNSIYDPVGICGPCLIDGKLLLRKITSDQTTYDWDDPLPHEYLKEWEKWKFSLNNLSLIKLDRCFKSVTLDSFDSVTLHVFADSSKDCIGFVMYLRFYNKENSHTHVSFATGDSKIAPKNATSIPRLELCAAVLAVEAAARLKKQLTLEVDCTFFYVDSAVVLGYINNEVKRFTKYVSRRVEIIRSFSSPSQWSYISTDINPADIATRPTTPEKLLRTSWLTGPELLAKCSDTTREFVRKSAVLDEPLPELLNDKPSSLQTKVVQGIFDNLLLRVSSWHKIKNVAQIVLSATKFFCRQKIK